MCVCVCVCVWIIRERQRRDFSYYCARKMSKHIGPERARTSMNTTYPRSHPVNNCIIFFPLFSGKCPCVFSPFPTSNKGSPRVSFQASLSPLYLWLLGFYLLFLVQELKIQWGGNLLKFFYTSKFDRGKFLDTIERNKSAGERGIHRFSTSSSKYTKGSTIFAWSLMQKRGKTSAIFPSFLTVECSLDHGEKEVKVRSRGGKSCVILRGRARTRARTQTHRHARTQTPHSGGV